MQNPSTLTTLGGFLAGLANNVAVPVLNAVGQNQTTQTQLKLQELRVQEAQRQKEAAQAAAANTSKIFSNKTIETILIWTLTTIAGGVLVSVVMKAAGLRK